MQNFNPHSHEGSDSFGGYMYSNAEDFNPHSHEGSDVKTEYVDGERIKISIHTPTKGATNNTLDAVSYTQLTLPTNREV